MFLLIGEPEDTTIASTRRAMAALGRPTLHLTEAQLYGTPFELHRNGPRVDGALFPAAAEPLPLAEVSGVLLRVRRAWWPEDGFDLPDASFVFHETLAAWIAVLKALKVPTVNDFGLGWWLGDPSYPEALRQDLARHLELRAPPSRAGAAGIEEWLIAGRLVLGPSGNSAPTALAGEALRDWQRQTGIHFARVDLASDGGAVLAVDPFPGMPPGPAGPADRVGEALARLLVGAAQ
ncbi:hypothetical protein [Falsiroseomonas sp. E2-1-a4]|uniref:hypothetical protein n=1 Tax=Falsiroseomonas sp. E2-1-a4 TaxID=3239299 RepID=UPI003F3B358F